MKKKLMFESQLIVDKQGKPRRFTKRGAINELRKPFDSSRIVLEDCGDHWSAQKLPLTLMR